MAVLCERSHCKLSVPELMKRCEDRTIAKRKCCHRNGGASHCAILALQPGVLFVAVMRTQRLCAAVLGPLVSVATPRFLLKLHYTTGQYSEQIR